MSTTLLILNLGAGSVENAAAGEKLCQTVQQAYLSRGRELNYLMVEPDEIEASLRDQLSQKPQAVLIAGGDGTVSTAAKILGGSGIALGIVPLGTFNLAARDLGIPLELEDAAAFLAEAEPIAIDVLQVGKHHCLCTCILGFYPQFSKQYGTREHAGKWWRKLWMMLTTLPKSFKRAKALHLEWTDADGKSGKVKSKFCAFVPGRYRENVSLIPQRTGFQDGTLSAYLSQHRHTAEAVRGSLDFIFGRQAQSDQIIHFQTRELNLIDKRRQKTTIMLDGEMLPMTFPFKLSILARHLMVLSKPEIAEQSEQN